MFEVGEFLKLMQVPVRMLCYYDQEGLLKPEQTDLFTNYRLYSADQILSLNRILFLRGFGFGVPRIREALEHWDQTFILDLLERKRLETQDRIRAEQTRFLDIEQAERDLFKNTTSVNYNVFIKAVPCCRVLPLCQVTPDYYGEEMLWEEVSLYMGKRDISISDHTFTIYHDMDRRERDADVEVCALVPELGEDGEGFTYRTVEAVPYITGTMARGPFENISGTYRGFASRIQEHNQYRMTGQSRQTVYREPWNETDPQDHPIETQIPLEKCWSLLTLTWRQGTC